MKGNAAEGTQLGVFSAYAMEHWGLEREEAVKLFQALVVGWTYRLQIIPYVDQLSAIERHEFEQVTRGLYGTSGVPQKFYELYIKQTQHPDAVRYVEELIARTP